MECKFKSHDVFGKVSSQSEWQVEQCVALSLRNVKCSVSAVACDLKWK